MDLTGSRAASLSARARGSIAASTVEDSMAAGSTVDAAFMVAATAAAGSDAVVAFMDVVASDAVLQAAVSQDTVEVASTAAVEVVSTAVVDSTVVAAIGNGRSKRLIKNRNG
jgi:hypothetical protein